MPDTESYHHRGDAAVARLDLVAVAPPAAPATTTTTACDEEEDEDGFTFAAVTVSVAVPVLQATDCADARIGPVYPVFGRPRWSPPKEQQQRQDDEEEEEGPTAAGKTTVRVQLGRLLLEDRWCDCAPSASGQQQQQQPVDAAAELDGVPAETYCLWSPGVSPPAPAGTSGQTSPARCRKSGPRPTGSPVLLRWRRQRRVAVERSHSDDGKDKFVSFLGTNSDRIGRGSGAARGGGTSSTTTSFLPCASRILSGWL